MNVARLEKIHGVRSRLAKLQRKMNELWAVATWEHKPGTEYTADDPCWISPERREEAMGQFEAMEPAERKMLDLIAEHNREIAMARGKGRPMGWTDLKEQETPSSPKLPSGLDAGS